MNKKFKEEIPIFFAVDDNYIPFLGVALKSLIENSSKEYKYKIKILYTSVSDSNIRKIKSYENESCDIEFVNLNCQVEKIRDKLYTRDYFSNTTYYRLLIPELYPEYSKAIYLDSDIVVLKDIAKLYNTNIEGNLLAAAPDDVIQTIEVFQNYAEKVVGVSNYENYFNAGILVMNLKELREFKFKEKFMYLLSTTKFSVAQDQDYLNRLCKGKVVLIPKTWNKMPVSGDCVERAKINLVHYNLAFKPWKFDNTLYQEYFWKYAKKTEFYDEIVNIKKNYTDEDRERDSEGDKKLRALAQIECDCVGDDRVSSRVNNNVRKDIVTSNVYFGSEDSNQFFESFLAYEG
ncbi:MAG: glycosyltransferase family 8 protein [Clostridia bacterium]|nr:glycosyltransferase family 8 protein [Clostridia bacterium]